MEPRTPELEVGRREGAQGAGKGGTPPPGTQGEVPTERRRRWRPDGAGSESARGQGGGPSGTGWTPGVEKRVDEGVPAREGTRHREPRGVCVGLQGDRGDSGLNAGTPIAGLVGVKEVLC